ncbi:MAG: exonuclease domain-containing protein [Candidatus Saccharimonadales bacterium]
MFNFPVVFVDIETTGGSYRNSRVLEVAAIRYENGVVVNEFTTLLNPSTHIPQSITALTGISERDVVDAPEFNDIADQLMELMDGAVFIAHNVRFDYSFLKNEFAMVGMNFAPKLFCTVRLSRKLYSGHKGHSLEKIIARHNIPVLDRHRALEDARAILYFSQLAYDEHHSDVFIDAVDHQLKSQSLPPNLDIEELDRVDNVPGVYIFKDDVHHPIYVGKSISLKKRIMSHFSDTSPKETKISQNVHHIETIPTSSELGALILESKLIKEMKPLYNRLLRRVTKYAMIIKVNHDGYSSLIIKSGNVEHDTDLSSVYGIFPSRTKAKASIDELTRTFQLCPKLMGLEKTKGACFNYSLKRCNGACSGSESAELYNSRFEIALERSRISEWNYEGPIVIPINSGGEQVIINNWMIQGFVSDDGMQISDQTDMNFDLDEYKIIKRFIKENSQSIVNYKNAY